MNSQRLGGMLVGVVLGTLLAVPSASTSANVTGPALIRVTNSESGYRLIDVAARGRSAGDTEIIKQRIFNKRVRESAIGHAELLCTFVDRQNRNCNGTYFMPRGRLVVAGSLRFREFYVLAVVGGTGLYNNARGTLTVTRANTRPTRDLVVFRLAG